MVCLGSWANLQKLTGKWRYELFYFDFSFGVALTAILAAYTLGSLQSSELTFQDNLLIASYHKISYALEGGVLLNLATLLLSGAISVAPMATVFPVAMGTALVVGTAGLLFPPQGSALILGGGLVLVLAAIILSAFSYVTYTQEQRAIRTPLRPDPRTPGGAVPRPPTAAKGILLSLGSGIVLGLSHADRHGAVWRHGLGAYTAGLLFGLAALGSTFVFAPFFITFAVHGAPVNLRAYFKGRAAQHLCGLLGGAVWCTGLIATFASGGPMSKFQADPLALQGFSGGAAVLATLWGLVAWREFRDGVLRIRILLIAMLILWMLGAAMVALAQG